ncbi:MAG: MFS transporter [Cytophagaceae bacterium]
MKASILSALVLAFAGFGDAFLYSVLPVNALHMGIPVVWIGFLLSINRFIRLVSNQAFAFLFGIYGFKTITIIAAVFAVLTTLVYGITSSLFLWIAARIIWGFCYSALRISSISYALENTRQGLHLGVNRGLQEVGPIFALLAGPILLQWTSVSTTFIILSISSAVSVIIAFKLPEIQKEPMNYSFSFNFLPSSFNFLTFLSSLIVQGLLVVVIGRLFLDEDNSFVVLTALTSFYLVYRRICSIFVSPLSGWYADIFGIQKVYLISIVCVIIGLIFISAGYSKVGILTAFTFNSISSALSPGGATLGSYNQIKAVALNNTWSDTGAAIGALIAGSILHLNDLQPVFCIATLGLLLAFIFHILITKNKTTVLIEWK